MNCQDYFQAECEKYLITPELAPFQDLCGHFDENVLQQNLRITSMQKHKINYARTLFA